MEFLASWSHRQNLRYEWSHALVENIALLHISIGYWWPLVATWLYKFIWYWWTLVASFIFILTSDRYNLLWVGGTTHSTPRHGVSQQWIFHLSWIKKQNRNAVEYRFFVGRVGSIQGQRNAGWIFRLCIGAPMKHHKWYWFSRPLAIWKQHWIDSPYMWSCADSTFSLWGPLKPFHLIF